MSQLTDLSEKELIVMVNRGHHGAFFEVYDRFKGALSYNLLRVLKDSELAEEVLQDVFLMLWEKRAELDPDRSISGYLYTSAINKTKNIYRQLATDQRMREAFLRDLESSYSSNAHLIMEEKEVKDVLYSLLDRLPPQQRKVFILCKLDGLSYREVSELLQISETTVNSHIRNANKVLQREVKKKADLSSALYMSLLWLLLF